MDITASSPTNCPTNVSLHNSTALILPHLNFADSLPGHSSYGAGARPRSWCRFRKQSQVLSVTNLQQEGCWTNGTISEFLSLPLHSFGFRLSIFSFSIMVSWTGRMELLCPFLGMLCLNQHVQDHPQLLPEAHLGVGSKCPWCPWLSGDRSGTPGRYPAPQTKPGCLLHPT